MADSDTYKIVIIGYDVQAKVSVANALMEYVKDIKQHMCRRLIVTKPITSKHIITGKFTTVVSPGFDTPSWPYAESRIKEYPHKTIVYVHKVGHIQRQGRAYAARIKQLFGQSRPFLVVYHDEECNAAAKTKAKQHVTPFGANYVCINSGASKATKFDITRQLLRAISNMLIEKDRKLPPKMQKYRDINFFTVNPLKPTISTDVKRNSDDVKKYVDDAERLKSFDTWPANVTLMPKLLCDAGFYFTGENDICTCCRCYLSLTDWNERHDPWVEHCRHTSDCVFIEDRLGRTFLMQVKSEIDKLIKKPGSADDNLVDIKRASDRAVATDTRAVSPDGRHANMSRDHLELYNETLYRGMVHSNHIRVNIVGHQSVGKTTLLKRLQGVNIKCPDPKQPPTEGIDVEKSITRCLLVGDTRCWQNGDEGLNYKMKYERMSRAMTDCFISERKENDHPDKEFKKHPIVKKVHFEIDIEIDDQYIEYIEGSDECDNLISIVEQKISKRKRNNKRQLDNAETEYLEKVVHKMSCSPGSSVYLSFWDYAGQITYYTTHQAFMSPLAVYLLVVDLSKPLDDQITDNLSFRKKGNEAISVLETLRFWNGSIEAYANTIHDISAPVIVVGTHMDKVDEQTANDMFERVRKEMQCEGVHCIAIDNTLQSTNNKAIADLKNAIIDSGQNIIERDIPAKWLRFEYQILKMKDEGKKIISFGTFMQLDKGESVDYFENVLEYMHCKGLVIAHRSLPGMSKEEKSNDIILDPNILVRFLNLIMRKRSKEDSLNKKKVQTLGWCSEGTFDERFAIEGMKREDPALVEYVKSLLNLLIHLRIAYPIDTSQVHQENKSFFMPCLLRQKPDDEYAAKSDECQKTPLVRISFTRKSIPHTLFHSLIASLLSKWPPEKINEELSIYYNYGCFRIKDETSLLEIFWKNACIYLYVITFDDDLALDDLEIDDLLMQIQHDINYILLIYRQNNVESKISVCCPEHKNPPSFLTFSELARGKKAMCCPSQTTKRHAVDPKSALGGWYSKDYRKTSESSRQGKDMHVTEVQEEVKIDTKIQTSLNTIVLGRVARLLSYEDATSLARLLRISQAYTYVESALNDGNGYPALARFFILEAWCEIEGENATVEKLVANITQTGEYLSDTILTHIKKDAHHLGHYKNVSAKMLESPPTDKQCNLIAKHINARDMLFFIDLGIDSATVKAELRNEVSSKAAILIMWRQNTTTGTVRVLLDTASMFEEINLNDILHSLSDE